MFPFDKNDEEIKLKIAKEDEPRDYEVVFYEDHDTGEICGRVTGKIVHGLAAIKQWIFICLHIARYKYAQYSWYYGNELESLLGQNYSKELVEAEAYRYIEEALLVNPFIDSIDNFECDVTNDSIKCKFDVNTRFGITQEEVSI